MAIGEAEESSRWGGTCTLHLVLRQEDHGRLICINRSAGFALLASNIEHAAMASGRAVASIFHCVWEAEPRRRFPSSGQDQLPACSAAWPGSALPLVTLTVEIEQVDDGRWLAEVPELSGVMAYGQDRDEAVARVQALALRVIAERLEHRETAAEVVNVRFQAA